MTFSKEKRWLILLLAFFIVGCASSHSELGQRASLTYYDQKSRKQVQLKVEVKNEEAEHYAVKPEILKGVVFETFWDLPGSDREVKEKLKSPRYGLSMTFENVFIRRKSEKEGGWVKPTALLLNLVIGQFLAGFYDDEIYSLDVEKLVIELRSHSPEGEQAITAIELENLSTNGWINFHERYHGFFTSYVPLLVVPSIWGTWSQNTVAHNLFPKLFYESIYPEVVSLLRGEAGIQKPAQARKKREGKTKEKSKEKSSARGYKEVWEFAARARGKDLKVKIKKGFFQAGYDNFTVRGSGIFAQFYLKGSRHPSREVKAVLISSSPIELKMEWKKEAFVLKNKSKANLYPFFWGAFQKGVQLRDLKDKVALNQDLDIEKFHQRLHALFPKIEWKKKNRWTSLEKYPFYIEETPHLALIYRKGRQTSFEVTLLSLESSDFSPEFIIPLGDEAKGKIQIVLQGENKGEGKSYTMEVQ